jgi:hypothetical protein
MSQAAADLRYAALAGLATQLFSVAAATASAHAVNLGQFTTGQVKSTAGNQPLPGGLIIKIGVTGSLPNGSSSITYPVAFPTATLNVVVTAQVSSGSSQGHDVANSYSAGGFSLYNGNTLASTFAWIAIGY